ncbi:hypothetical protein G6F31_021341 [Rhizopus arrhizus]|nr:hypothetical protein G6F31_021341 [Rhizopus arrhizus]
MRRRSDGYRPAAPMPAGHRRGRSPVRPSAPGSRPGTSRWRIHLPPPARAALSGPLVCYRLPARPALLDARDPPAVATRAGCAIRPTRARDDRRRPGTAGPYLRTRAPTSG